VNEGLGRRRQEDGDEDHQDRKANDAALRRLIGGCVKNDEREQEGKEHDKGWPQPAVSPPAFEHRVQSYHGRGC
jgi:hypothetical protein